MNDKKLRIYLTGVGGQGTLTATTLLSSILLDQGFQVVSGEIHGMAQRGGVVESTVLVGGWRSPSIYPGEADIILGFEALETLRGLLYLRQGGAVFSSTEFIPPSSVSAGKVSLPAFSSIQASVLEVSEQAWFLPTQTLGHQAGAVQSGNTALLGALFASGLLQCDSSALTQGIKKYLPAKIVEVNLKAAEFGAAAWAHA